MGIVVEEELEADDLRSVIAHEIAHLWLDHDFGVPSETWLRCELEASALVRDWGFAGMGADASDAQASSKARHDPRTG